MSSRQFPHGSKSPQSHVASSLWPCSSLPTLGASPLCCSAAYPLALRMPDSTHKPFTSKAHAQTDRRAHLGHRPSPALPTYAAPTWPLGLDQTLLLITPVANVCTRADGSSPSGSESAAQPGSAPSRSARAGPTPLWLHAPTLPTSLHIRRRLLGVRVEVSH